MKKTYIAPKTELAFCEIFQILQGTNQKTINPSGDLPPIVEGGKGGDQEIDFSNKGLWDD